jgi:hypothetical protein
MSDLEELLTPDPDRVDDYLMEYSGPLRCHRCGKRARWQRFIVNGPETRFCYYCRKHQPEEIEVMKLAEFPKHRTRQRNLVSTVSVVVALCAGLVAMYLVLKLLDSFFIYSWLPSLLVDVLGSDLSALLLSGLAFLGSAFAVYHLLEARLGPSCD